MKFDHIVNYNGTYYDAGEEVPIEEKKETDLVEENDVPKQSEETETTQRKQQKK